MQWKNTNSGKTHKAWDPSLVRQLRKCKFIREGKCVNMLRGSGRWGRADSAKSRDICMCFHAGCLD